MNVDERLAAFTAHQRTMRAFLESQGEVVRRVMAFGKLPSAPTLTEPIGRFVMRGRVAEIASLTDAPLSGLHLVTSDPSDPDVGRAAASILESRGAFVAMIDSARLREWSKLSSDVDFLRREHGPVCGIVHLAGLAELPMPESIAAWDAINEVQCFGLFALVQRCAADLNEVGGQVISISALDGCFGRERSEWHSLPSAAAVSGLLKTLAAEWSQITVKVIDIDDPAPTAVAAILESELSVRDGSVEIGYVGRERRVYEFASVVCGAASDPAPRWVPASDWVVLATGGARGITSECLREILLPGMTLVLLGRSPEPGVESNDTAGKTDMAELRQYFLQRLRLQGARTTPALVEKEVSTLFRDRDIRANLAEFRARGIRVEYHQADASDPTDLQQVLTATYASHGKIDAVLHGAGIVEDKLIADKTRESFARVYNTKSKSVFVLLHHLRPESLKCLVLFASVAGRAGNRGQGDYACANELLNRMAWWMHHRWPKTKVCAINWGPWESGMASPEINQQFRERGVVPIPTLAGRAFLRSELLSADRGPVESIAGTFHKLNESAFFPMTNT